MATDRGRSDSDDTVAQKRCHRWLEFDSLPPIVTADDQACWTAGLENPMGRALALGPKLWQREWLRRPRTYDGTLYTGDNWIGKK